MNEAAKRWINLPPEEQLRENLYYKGRYESAHLFMGRPIETAWEDLTHEQRVHVQQECIRHQREMDAFGDMIRSGVSKTG